MSPQDVCRRGLGLLMGGCDGGDGDGNGDGDGDGDDDRCCASVYSPWRLQLTPQAVCSIS